MNKTLAAFHADDSFVRGLLGPIGSGKSVGCCTEIMLRAQRQAACNGVRRTRWTVVRSTYPELKTTTLSTWKMWVPEHVCKLRMDAPITGTVMYRLPDGTRVEAEILFLALDRDDDVKKVLSLDITGAWVNEAREVPKTIIDALTGRVGRYPSGTYGACTWSGIMLDTNAPDDDHWWHDTFEEKRPAGWKLFRQPPAMLKTVDKHGVAQWHPNPLAENLANLPKGYYERQIPGKDESWIRVYIEGKYGRTLEGRPVWPEFKEEFHVSKDPLKPIPGAPLLLGWDYGLCPSCVFGQLTPRGQLLVFEECIGESIGVRGVISAVVRPLLLNRWRGFKIHSYGDPAGAQRQQTDERTCFEELAAAGIPTEPTATNEFVARRECVAGFLNGLVDGNPRFLLDPKISKLRKGMNGGYFFKRVQISAKESVYRDEPVKNMASHICEALQYLCLGADPALNVSSRMPPIVLKGVRPAGWV